MNGNLNLGSVVRLTVNDDPNRVISFDPGDLGLAERTYKMLADYDEQSKAYRARAQVLADASFETQVEFVRGVCEDMERRIDGIFGLGTSLAAFGETLRFDMFEQFFNGVIPYIEEARKKKMEKYEVKKPEKNLTLLR